MTNDQIENLLPIKEPLTLVLLGATGDLAKKKVLKAVYQLAKLDILPQPFFMIGVARQPMKQEEFVKFVYEQIKPDDLRAWERILPGIRYVSGDLLEFETYEKIGEMQASLPDCGNHLWYLATLPSLYVDAVKYIGQAGLNQSACGWTKIMLEKPFGTDFKTAKTLNEFLSTIFSEDQIYRIDHFLAKETVQNLLIFRFANGIFEHLWDRHHISQIQVHAIEPFGVTGRGELYEKTGTVRDVVQNHVLELIATTMMSEPADMSAKAINKERNKLLDSLKVLKNDKGVPIASFGQYTPGVVEGTAVKGYLDEASLKTTESKTETAVVAAFEADTDRWRGIPIIIKAGKRLHAYATEISIQFKEPQNRMFGKKRQQPNVLTLMIAPNEGVVVRYLVKKPGLSLQLEEAPMQFCYRNVFGMDLVEAYVKLLYDAITGDASLFPDSLGIEAAWKAVQPILDYKRSPQFEVEPYAAGTKGPKSFEEFPKSWGFDWIEPDGGYCGR